MSPTSTYPQHFVQETCQEEVLARQEEVLVLAAGEGVKVAAVELTMESRREKEPRLLSNPMLACTPRRAMSPIPLPV